MTKPTRTRSDDGTGAVIETDRNVSPKTVALPTTYVPVGSVAEVPVNDPPNVA
jgi:hypothetical protein